MSAGPARGGTILLVEDEEDIAALVRTYLENDGFRVIWAPRGADGAWHWSSTTFALRSWTSSSPTRTASTSAG